MIVRWRGAARIRTGGGGFADLCLTTWLRRPGTANLMADNGLCNQSPTARAATRAGRGTTEPRNYTSHEALYPRRCSPSFGRLLPAWFVVRQGTGPFTSSCFRASAGSGLFEIAAHQTVKQPFQR